MAADLDWGAVTPERLQAVLDEGKSYSQVAKMFGVTRNKVSGQVYRWRLAGHMPAARSRGGAKMSEKPPTNKPRSKNLPFTLSGKTLQRAPPAAYRPPAPAAPRTLSKPTNAPVTLMGLEHGMCAYPVGEKPYMFCGCTEITNFRLRLCAYHEQGFFDRSGRKSRARKARPGG